MHDSFILDESAENAGLTHLLLIAWKSRSVSVKLLYVSAAMSKVLYHSPFLTLADRGPYIVLKADTVLNDNVLGAMRTMGPSHRQRTLTKEAPRLLHLIILLMILQMPDVLISGISLP